MPVSHPLSQHSLSEPTESLPLTGMKAQQKHPPQNRPRWFQDPTLTCFITYLALVFISFTTTFTPKAPGLSSCKIYQDGLSANVHSRHQTLNSHPTTGPKARPAG